MPGQMFLRTALTENRIEALEKKLEWVMKFLKVPPEPVLTDEKKLTQTDEEWDRAAPEDEPLPIRPKPAKGKSARG